MLIFCSFDCFCVLTIQYALYRLSGKPFTFEFSRKPRQTILPKRSPNLFETLLPTALGTRKP